MHGYSFILSPEVNALVIAEPASLSNPLATVGPGELAIILHVMESEQYSQPQTIDTEMRTQYQVCKLLWNSSNSIA
jgi:hypothetical protein